MRSWPIFLLVFLGAGCVSAGESVVGFPDGASIRVEIADGLFEQAKGLAGRETLSQEEGLLFLHGSPAIQRYWMKGMLIPIDIIWINGKTVEGYVQDAQPEPPPFTIYASPTPVDKVLEVSAGFVAAHRVNIGDTLDIRLADE